MKEKKIISILKTFSLHELKDFEKFIESPYHNQGRNFKPFYRILKKQYPDFPEEKLSYKILYKKLFPNKKYYEKMSTTAIRVLYSKMGQLGEEFLTEKGLRKNNIYREICLLRELNRRCLVKLLDNNFIKTEEKLDQEIFDSNYFLYKFLIKNEISIVFKETNIKDVKNSAKNLDIALESLIVYLVYRLIDYKQNRNIIFDKEIPHSELVQKFLESLDLLKIVNDFKTDDSIYNDVFNLFYYSYLLTTDLKDENNYESLKSLFFKLRNKINFDIKSSILMKLMNFCNYHLTDKKQYFQFEYLELNRIWIEISLSEKNYYPFQVRGFRNVIIIHAKSKLFELAEEYIKKYSKYINKEIRNDCINYAKSRIAFERGDFEKALEYSGKCNFNIPMMIKDIKYIKLQSFLELCYYDAFKSETDAFRHFLKDTSGIPESVIEYDKKVLKYFVKFAGIKEKNVIYEIEVFYEELTNFKTNNDYILWLIKKIEILKKNFHS